MKKIKIFKSSLEKDLHFILYCAIIAATCFLGAIVQHSVSVSAVILLAIMTICIGAGALRLMHVIRDL